MTRSCIALVLVVIVVLATATQASAQASTTDHASPPLELEAHRLPDPSAGPRVEPTGSLASPSRAVPWNARRAKRGAFLAGFGTGLAAVSAPYAIAFGRAGTCYSREPSYSVAARYWASTAAGLGGAIAITGSGLLFSQRRSVRVAHRERRARGLQAPGMGALGFLLGFLAGGALVVAPSFSELLDCISS